ncbi:MAG: Hcp family type VI secretion system effector [Gaiellaceae bacterium]
MAYDAFLKIEGIPGESLDSKHKDWIEVLSFSWGVSQPHSSSGQFTGHLVPEDFTFSHAVDKSSPKLMLACAQGDQINEVDVSFRKAGSSGGGIDYLKYSFFDVFFSSERPGGQSVAQQVKIEDALPFEEVTFTYGKVMINYQQLDSRGRQVGAPIQSALDFENFGDIAGAAAKKH